MSFEKICHFACGYLGYENCEEEENVNFMDYSKVAIVALAGICIATCIKGDFFLEKEVSSLQSRINGKKRCSDQWLIGFDKSALPFNVEGRIKEIKQYSSARRSLSGKEVGSLKSLIQREMRFVDRDQGVIVQTGIDSIPYTKGVFDCIIFLAKAFSNKLIAGISFLLA